MSTSKRGRPVLLIGSPSSRPHVWAKRYSGVARGELDECTVAHLATAQNYTTRVAGLASKGGVRSFPFRAPHHTVSAAGMRGVVLGGWRWQPGELSLAHGGTLYLGEATEFHPEVLAHVVEAVGQGCLSFSGEEREGPARLQMTMLTMIMLIASATPCPCGWFRFPALCERECECTHDQVVRHLERLGPLFELWPRVLIHDGEEYSESQVKSAPKLAALLLAASKLGADAVATGKRRAAAKRKAARSEGAA